MYFEQSQEQIHNRLEEQMADQCVFYGPMLLEELCQITLVGILQDHRA